MFDLVPLLLFLLVPVVVGELILLFVLFGFFRKHNTKPGWRQVLMINAASAVVILICASLGGEFYYRYVYDTTDGFAYTKVSQKWFKRHCVYNNSGCRDNVAYLLEPKAGKRRISFLGDSFTEGHGVKNVEDRFVNLIRAKHPEWEIHALAKIGHDTGNEIETLKDGQAAGYKFDVVVLVYCLNDMTDISTETTTINRDLFSEAASHNWLLENSYFFEMLYYRAKVARNPRVSGIFSTMREEYNGALWEVQKTRLKTIQDLVQANGGRLAVVTFPFLNLEGPAYQFEPVHRQLDQFWRESGVPHLDLHPVFATEPPGKITVNPYDAHPNEYAHALAAKKIDQFLTELLAQPPSKHP